MSKIKTAFTDKRAFIPFITCGDPDLDTTAEAARAAAENGADIIIFGIPFSDPTAEGPVVQNASLRALAGGVTTDKIFDFVKELRSDVKIPFVFMTYANVVFSYGIERFMTECQKAEVDGIIIHDVPYEEKREFSDTAKEYGIDVISIIAPAPAARIAMIAKEAEGFIYLISGNSNDSNIGIVSDPTDMISVIRENTDVPCVMNTDSDKTDDIPSVSDGVIAGTAVISLIEAHGKDAVSYVGEYVKSAKASL